MAVNFKTPGLHHVNLRCKDLNLSKKFYGEVLGFPIAIDIPDFLFAFPVGGVYIVFKQAEADHKFEPMTIGTDHLAMACESEEELARAAKELEKAGIENTGVKLDETLKKNYVAFKDPDRIQWEFYMV